MTTCSRCGYPVCRVPRTPRTWVVDDPSTTADGLSYCPPDPDASRVTEHRPQRTLRR